MNRTSLLFVLAAILWPLVGCSPAGPYADTFAAATPAPRRSPWTGDLVPVAAAPPTSMPATATPTHTPTPEPTATPAATPKPGPDEPFAFVARYRDACVALLERVPALPQLRSLSCEAAAIRMVLAGRGIVVSEDEVLARMGSSPNPHQGFRGNPDGDPHHPGLADYGTYAEVVERVLESFGAPAETVYGMSDDALRAAIADGRAVIVWVTAREDPRIVEEDGYRLVEEEHVYVVVGVLRDGCFLVHDPWGVRADSLRDGTFAVWTIRQWDLFGRMAVVTPLD